MLCNLLPPCLEPRTLLELSMTYPVGIFLIGIVVFKGSLDKTVLITMDNRNTSIHHARSSSPQEPPQTLYYCSYNLTFILWIMSHHHCWATCWSSNLLDQPLLPSLNCPLYELRPWTVPLNLNVSCIGEDWRDMVTSLYQKWGRWQPDAYDHSRGHSDAFTSSTGKKCSFQQQQNDINESS